MTPLRTALALALGLLLFATVAVADEASSGKVTASSLNVRSGPGTEHGVVFRLERNAEVRIVDRRGVWLRVEAGGRSGWVHGKYVASSVPEELPAPLASLPKTRKERLRFVHDATRSTLDLLGDEGRALRAFAWERNDYPGSPSGPNETKARRISTLLQALRPERRVNTGPVKLPFDWSAIEPNLVPVPGQERRKLHRAAAESFAKMRAAAKADGVTLTIVSAARTPEHQKRLAGRNKNGAAVAQGVSTHNYGLAIDLAMSPGAAAPVQETTTRPFSNVMAMRATPAHKWVFFFGAEHGWFPYTNEPWHWEYNPEGLAQSFP